MTSMRDVTERPAPSHDGADAIAAEMEVWRRRYDQSPVRAASFASRWSAGRV